MPAVVGSATGLMPYRAMTPKGRVMTGSLRNGSPGAFKQDKIRPEEIYYIYRWYGTGSYHLSGHGGLKRGENSGDSEVMAYVQQRANRGEIPLGHILLQPSWKTD